MTTSTMPARELFPCPFCGKPPYVAEEIDPDDWWYVACQTPGCVLPIAGGHTSIESAIEHWNRRAPIHASDCAVHNEPAYPNGPCDCGAVIPSQRQEEV